MEPKSFASDISELHTVSDRDNDDEDGREHLRSGALPRSQDTAKGLTRIPLVNPSQNTVSQVLLSSPFHMENVVPRAKSPQYPARTSSQEVLSECFQNRWLHKR